MSNLLDTFIIEKGVHFQKGLIRNNGFEKKYLSIREKEKRIYTDEQVAALPEIPLSHDHYQEWKLRSDSLQRLIRYTNKNQFKTILDLGCGNGWMSRHLAMRSSDVFAMDVNEFELTQGARVNQNVKNLHFVFANILSKPFNKEKIFDLIVLSSSIQYFPDLHKLVEHLEPLLTESGEIHIIDSPLYNKVDLPAAQQRTAKYYQAMGLTDAETLYFHHTWKSLELFRAVIAYNPQSFSSKIKKLVNPFTSPFPWIIIRK